jgi:hypothetical protein
MGGDATGIFATIALGLVVFGAINVYGTLDAFAAGAPARRPPR